MTMNSIRIILALLICGTTAAVMGQETMSADLRVALTASPVAAYPGTEIGFQADVFNKGPDTAIDVRLESLLPYRLTPVSVSTGAGPALIDDQKISYTIPVLEPDTTVTIYVRALLVGNGRGLTTVVLTAESSVTADPIPDDNSSTQTITILWPNEADVGVSGRALDYEITLSEDIVLELSTSCYGPDSAWDISSALFLPAQIEVKYATTSLNSAVTTSSGLVSFATPALDPWQSARHMVVAKPLATGSFTIQWQIFGSGGGDWTSINNFAPIQITVEPSGPSRADSCWQLYP